MQFATKTAIFGTFTFFTFLSIYLLIPDLNFKINNDDTGSLTYCNITDIQTNNNIISWYVTVKSEIGIECKNQTNFIIKTSSNYYTRYIYKINDIRKCYYTTVEEGNCIFNWMENKTYKIVAIVLLSFWLLMFLFFLFDIFKYINLLRFYNPI